MPSGQIKVFLGYGNNPGGNWHPGLRVDPSFMSFFFGGIETS